jgi:uncharacterized protein
MRVVVSGATGTIGRAVVGSLCARGDAVVALTRDERRARESLPGEVVAMRWAEPTDQPPPRAALAGADAMLHLLGEPIDQRWTADAKRRIRGSRVLSTNQLVTALLDLDDEERPAALVAQSATGFYGDGNLPLDEQAPAGDGFLADLVIDWEREAQTAAARMRVVCTRTGVVLSPRGGALARMLPFFRLGVGGPVAGGGQYVPWVHLDDVVGALLRCLDDERAAGPINVTAPTPVTNAELSRALGRVLKRPAVLPVPALALRLLYGEMSQVVTESKRVVPGRLQALGYRFRHADLQPALDDALTRA